VKWLRLALIVLLCAAPALAEENSWERVIQRFEAKDAEAMPEPGGILFVGSSSIVFWKTDEAFPGAGVINRGFGGSTVPDVLHFFDRIVTKYAPSKIVFYSGDNDIAKGHDPERVIADYQTFLDRVAEALPEAEVRIVAIKPSLARWDMWPAMKEVNDAVAAMAEDRDNVEFVDVAPVMLTDDGKPDPDVFVTDGLHLNAEGYVRWNGLVREFVEAGKKKL